MLNAKKFAASEALPVETVRRFCKQGLIPHIRVGRRYMIDADQGHTALLTIAEGACKRKTPYVEPTRHFSKERILDALKEV